MPVRKVGPNSYQWGTSGKVYTGKDAKAKAERQGRAIYASGYKGAEDESDEEYWEPYLEALKDWYNLCYATVNEAAESYAGMVQNINLWLAVEEVSNERLSYILEKTWKYKYLAIRLLWNQEVDAYHYLELMDNYLSPESASLLENFNPEGRDYEGEIVYTSWYTPYPELKVVREVFQPSWLPSEDWQGRWAEPYAFELYGAESYKPPASAVANAKRGLKLRKEWGRGGLSPSEAAAQGIDSGVTRARKIASGKVSRHDVRRMSAFNRHRKNYRPDKKMSDGGPTAGTIAWLLWGGTSGVNWAKKKSATMNAETFEAMNIKDGLLHCDACDADVESDRQYGTLTISCGSCGNTLYEDDSYGKFDMADYYAESFEAQRYQKQKQCAVCLDYEPYNKMMSCFVCGQNYCAACEKYDSCAEYSSENWGGDPDGPLAKALAQARESSKQPRKPLQITRLPDPNQKTLKDFEAQPHFYGNCDECKQPMLLGVEIKNRYGFGETPSAKICQECDYVVCGSCYPQAKNCINCNKSFNADWQDLPRNELGQWQRPVSEEVLQMLVDSDSMPTLSELLEMYGGDTPTNRWKLYKALMDIYISNDPTEDTIVDFSDNLEIETPEEYYQFILQEELDIPEDEDDTQSIEFWDRYSRYVASVYTSEEIEFMIAEAIESIDLFADEGNLKEITALNAALKLQSFMEKYQAE